MNLLVDRRSMFSGIAGGDRKTCFFSNSPEKQSKFTGRQTPFELRAVARRVPAVQAVCVSKFNQSEFSSQYCFGGNPKGETPPLVGESKGGEPPFWPRPTGRGKNSRPPGRNRRKLYHPANKGPGGSGGVEPATDSEPPAPRLRQRTWRVPSMSLWFHRSV